jgi:hypothetical protein
MHAQLQSPRQPILPDSVRDHRQVVELFFELRRVAHIIHALVEAAENFGAMSDRDSLARNRRQNTSSSGGVCGAVVSSIETSVTNSRRPGAPPRYVKFCPACHGEQILARRLRGIASRRR